MNNEVDLLEGSYSSYAEEWPQVMFKAVQQVGTD